MSPKKTVVTTLLFQMIKREMKKRKNERKEMRCERTKLEHAVKRMKRERNKMKNKIKKVMTKLGLEEEKSTSKMALRIVTVTA